MTPIATEEPLPTDEEGVAESTMDHVGRATALGTDVGDYVSSNAGLTRVTQHGGLPDGIDCTMNFESQMQGHYMGITA